MEELSLSDLIAPIRRHMALIVGISLLVMVLAILHTHFFVPTTWDVDTSIVFEEQADAGVTMLRQFALADALGRGAGRGAFLEFLAESRSVRGRVVDRLDLVEAIEDVDDRDHAINVLGRACNVKLPTSGVLVLSVSWEGRPSAAVNPGTDEAAMMATLVAQEMIRSLEDEVSQNAYTDAARKLGMLEEQLERAHMELLQSEDMLVDYAMGEGLVNPGGQGTAIVAELQSLRKREGELQGELNAALSREAEARQRLSDQERMVVTTLSEGRDPAVVQLRARILELQKRIAEQKQVQGKSDEHPDVASLLSELESTEAQLAEVATVEMEVDRRTYTVDDSYSSLVAEVMNTSLQASSVRANINAVRGLRQAAMAEVTQFPEKSAVYGRLQREVEIKSQTVASLTESYEMARVAEATSTASFRVIDEPVVPRGASGPSLKKTVVVALAASLLLTSLIAFWIEGRREESIEKEPESLPANVA